MARYRRIYHRQKKNPQTPLYEYLNTETYDLCLKNLANNKTPGPDKIPNIILKNMPECFHNLLYLFFTHCYKQKQIPASWKVSLTILLYKKGDPSQLSNHRPIALANTIYKLFTSTLTSILSAYGEKYQILHDSQEGFRAERSTARQLQTLIAALEDARFTNQNIYILYIDFKKCIRLPRPCKTPRRNERSWIPNRCNSPYRKHIFAIHHHIHWRPFWQNKTNTNTKRHHPRRHTEPIPLPHILRTTITLASNKQKWIHIWHI